MSGVVLPIAQTPISSFQYIAYVLAVLLNYRECLPWFYSNYIQLEYYRDKQGETLNFVGAWITDVPWIEFQYHEKADFVKRYGNVYQTLKDCLREGWYIYSHFDEFHIPHRIKSNRIHFRIDFLLYGYDDEAQEFSILGYGNEGVFEASQISYSDFFKAFESGMESNYESPFSHPPCVLLFRKREDYVFEFNLKYLHEMLSDYALGQNTTARLKIEERKNETRRVFGLNTYNYLIRYLELIGELRIRNIHRALNHSARSLNVLWEHKKCMLLRLDYLNQIGLMENLDYFSGFYQRLESELLILRKRLFTYTVKEDLKLLGTIMESLREIKNDETDIMAELLGMTEES